MKNIVFVLFLLMGFSSAAQIFYPFNKQRPAYYDFSRNNNIFSYTVVYSQAAIAIDSFTTNSGNITFFHSHIIDNEPGCYSAHDTSFTGFKSIRTLEGDDIFFNRRGDSLVFKNNVTPGLQWTFCRLKNGHKIIASVQSINQQSILGVADSVVAIEVTGEYPADSIPSVVFKIGKTTGLISGYSMFHFPMDTVSFSIVGIENPSHGLSSEHLKPAEVFNFNVGDRFDHVLKSVSQPAYYYNGYQSRVILSKSISSTGDSLIYKVQLRNLWWQQNMNSVTNGAVTDTVTEIYSISQYQFLNTKPFQWIKSQGTFPYLIPSVYPGYSTSKIFRTDFGGNDSCLAVLTFDGPPYFIFSPGLGKTYDFSGEIYENYSYDTLVYFRKYRSEWGDSINFNQLASAKEIYSLESVSIFPNPAGDYITIRNIFVSTPFNCEAFNALGQLVLSKQMDGAVDNRLNVKDLPTGMYFLRIQYDKQVINMKFIKS